MAEYFSLQASLCFSIAHILIRRGLVGSNALTGSFISLTMTAGLLWLLIPFFVPLSALWNPAVALFAAAGIFAPGIGRTLNYVGIERVGIARSVPIVNSSPIFASVLAVIFLGEVWLPGNIAGTCLVILGVVTLSLSKPQTGVSRKIDIMFPIAGAIAFAISTTLRKSGLEVIGIPLLGAGVTAAAAAVFSLVLIQSRGGTRAFMLSRKSAAWLIPAGVFNTAATLSVFYALRHGPVVVVEPLVSSNPLLTLLLTSLFLRDLEALSLRVIIGALLTVAGTILVVTVR